MATSKIRLKLLVDTKGHRVLFAEAGKDFVDLLFSLLSLPIGTVIRLLTKRNMVGCIGKVYDSFESLSDTYMQPNLDKDSLLNPKTSCAVGVPLLLTDKISEDKMVYVCGSQYNHRYWSDNPQASCPQCRNSMSNKNTFVAPKSVQTTAPVEGGYVKGVVTYMVMDNLEVKPMSTISGITLINKYNVKDLSGLEERMVDFTFDEAPKLLKSSLQSDMVLTSVYLGKVKSEA